MSQSTIHSVAARVAQLVVLLALAVAVFDDYGWDILRRLA